MLAAVHDDGACWRCGAPTGLRVACPACHAPQRRDGLDLFAVLGLPRRLTIAPDDLEARYLEASRLVHPDRHATQDAPTREASLAASAAVNRAYRTLRDPVGRGRYWLELHGEALGRDNNRVPPALAELVFETQEALLPLRATPQDPALRRAAKGVHAELDSRLRGLVGDLAARYEAWDAADPASPAVLAEMKSRLSEIAYLATLVGDVDEVLGV